MIHILNRVTIPRSVAVAVSGGVDSMSALDFLRRGPRDITAVHYNHGTPYAPEAEELVRAYCAEHCVPLVVGYNEAVLPAGVSQEAWWRDQRYKFFAQATDLKTITAHHLDDVVENWIFTSLNGNPFLIPHERDNYIRPFLATRKHDLVGWAVRRAVPFIEDPSNNNTRYRRNYIRHELMPHAIAINPGLHKTLRKKILDNPPAVVVR